MWLSQPSFIVFKSVFSSTNIEVEIPFLYPVQHLFLGDFFHSESDWMKYQLLFNLFFYTTKGSHFGLSLELGTAFVASIHIINRWMVGGFIADISDLSELRLLNIVFLKYI